MNVRYIIRRRQKKERERKRKRRSLFFIYISALGYIFCNAYNEIDTCLRFGRRERKIARHCNSMTNKSYESRSKGLTRGARTRGAAKNEYEEDAARRRGEDAVRRAQMSSGERKTPLREKRENLRANTIVALRYYVSSFRFLFSSFIRSG